MVKLSIIIPAYNEAPTIRQLVEKILKVDYGVDYEIIIVDDHSSDRTLEIAASLRGASSRRIKIFRNEVNQGKGFSVLSSHFFQRNYKNTKIALLRMRRSVVW